MSHTVLYRKYRPQKFADVMGQDHIVSVFEEAIKKAVPEITKIEVINLHAN
mgnify:CR=1 FL=1